MQFQHPLVKETRGKYPRFESEEGEEKDSRKTKLKHIRENFKIWISKISLTTYTVCLEHWDRCPDHDITSQEFHQFSKSYLTQGLMWLGKCFSALVSATFLALSLAKIRNMIVNLQNWPLGYWCVCVYVCATFCFQWFDLAMPYCKPPILNFVLDFILKSEAETA